MTLSFTESLVMILLTAACTFLTRLLPFAVFGRKKELPPAVSWLGHILPSAMMATLIVYCFRNVSLFSGSRGLPEFLAIALVALLHLWKRNTLLSIGLGTVFYMFLLRVI